jgi:hypothetical protein
MARRSWQRQCGSAPHRSLAAPGPGLYCTCVRMGEGGRLGRWVRDWSMGRAGCKAGCRGRRGTGRGVWGFMGLAAGLAVSLAGPPAKPGGGPCETDHKSITAALPAAACNSADSSPILGRAASHREVVGSSPCLTSFGVANVFCLPMQAAVLRWRTPFPSFRSPPPASNIQA